MQKLTLKEIAGYLPYKLQWVNTHEKIEEKWKLDGHEVFYVLSEMPIWRFCKPILLPLSMLTQDIEQDGEKFVPIVRLLGHEFLKKHNHSFGYDRKKYYSKFMIEHTNEWVYGNIPSDLQSMDYFTVSKLQEWHFDIHGLIERGLAIDKSPLNKT